MEQQEQMAPSQLQRVDIAALRKADYVSIRSRWDKAPVQHVMVARKEPSPEFPFGAEQWVFCDARISNHAGFTPSEASYLVMHPKYTPEWQTFTDALREGDKLVIDWVASNNSENLTKNGLVADEVKVQIDRTLKNGKHKTLTFFLDYVISGSDISRMVRR